MDTGNRKAVLAAMAANLGIAVAKFVGFAATGASSMLAEGVHSVADTGNQVLLLWGGNQAARAPDASHPFGYGRERYFWSFVVALILFSLGAVFAVYEGVHKLLHPEPLDTLGWAFGVLLLSAALEGLSFRTAIREARKVKGAVGWRAFVRRTKNPELPVVLLEDLGALVGLGLALIGVGLAALTGDARFDALGSIAIGVLLGILSMLLAVEMKSLLIGESATPEDQRAIVEAIERSPHVRRVLGMRTQHLGPEELLVAVKVEFDGGLVSDTLAAAINVVEAEVRARLPIAHIIYVEPDVLETRAAHDAAARPPALAGDT
ncbi:MAG: cation transporter [Planctomycetes bacterium]|nr:cation transporter [Planctomycetota bacterium]